MELESVQSATFWELEDRGYNFEFLTPDRKAELDNFLALPFEVESPTLTVRAPPGLLRARRHAHA